MKRQIEIEIPKDDLEKMKQIQLEMLLELDRICRKYGILYNLCAGTLLGAIRHKGFIPWDDDIDIRMLRSEYEKFCAVCPTELDKSRFFLQNETTDPGYRWAFARILRKGTEYVRIGQEELKQKTGVFIDIFPSDGMPEGPGKITIYRIITWLCRKILWSPVGAKISPNKFLRGVFWCLSKIPVWAPRKVLAFLAKHYDERTSKRVCCMGLKADKNIFEDEKIQQYGLKREWHTELIEVEFEKHKFFAPKDYDGWLLEGFGSRYMELPPENMRKVHHTVLRYQLLEEEK